MQEQVNEKTIALQVSAAKFTARELKHLMAAYLRYRKGKKQRNPVKAKTTKKDGKMTLEDLSKKHDGLKSIEISEKNIKDFEKTAKKYNLEYALKKDVKTEPPTYFVFFKGKDLDVIDFAFREYLKESMEKAKDNKPSIRKALKKMVDKAKEIGKTRDKLKDKEPSL